MNKKTVIIIAIIAAAAIILATAGLLVYKFILKKPVEEPERKENNVTVFRCHMAQSLTDADLAAIKETVTKAVGDKVLDIYVDEIPLPGINNIYDEDGEPVYFGDLAVIIFSVLSEEEYNKMAGALVNKFELGTKFEEKYLSKIMSIDTQYRAEYDK